MATAMHVSPETIESAARVCWELTEAVTAWDDAPEMIRERTREEVAAILDAAAPSMALNVLDRGPDAPRDAHLDVLAVSAQLTQAHEQSRVRAQDGVNINRQLAMAARHLLAAEDALKGISIQPRAEEED